MRSLLDLPLPRLSRVRVHDRRVLYFLPLVVLLVGRLGVEASVYLLPMLSHAVVDVGNLSVALFYGVPLLTV